MSEQKIIEDTEQYVDMLTNSYSTLFFHEDEFCKGCFIKFIDCTTLMMVGMIDQYIDDPILKNEILGSFTDIENISALH